MIIGIDPGCTTGVASKGPHDRARGSQFDSLEELVILLWGRIKPSDAVVMEDYLGAGKRDNPSKTTLEVIGAVKAVCALTGCQLVMQRPQERKAFVAEARKLLKAKHKDRHAADALAHILAYQWKQTQKGGESGCSGAD